MVLCFNFLSANKLLPIAELARGRRHKLHRDAFLLVAWNELWSSGQVMSLVNGCQAEK